MKTTLVLATTTLVLGTLVGATTPAVAAPSDAPPPRTSATVTDPLHDTTGTDPDRRSRADVRRVDYTMPLPRNSRTLTIDTTLRRAGATFLNGAPTQQVKTFIDGPGRQDYAVTTYNSSRSPRVVSLAGDRPRRIEPAGAGWGGSIGRNGGLVVTLTTEWLRAGDRADFQAFGISRRATDRTRTAPRLNVRYTARNAPNAAEGAGTYDDPTCSKDAAGTLTCSYGAL